LGTNYLPTGKISSCNLDGRKKNDNGRILLSSKTREDIAVRKQTATASEVDWT